MTSPKQIPDLYDHVGAGWRAILNDLHLKLVALEPSYSVAQLKEKFGSLRVHLNGDYREDLENVIDEASNAADRTCEFCGAPGEITRRDGYWWKARCAEH